MKCGTSTFFSHLTSHPKVAASRVKEPEFFSAFQAHGAEVNCYEDLWEFDPDQHLYCVEASTGYTKYPDEPHVPDRILAAGIQPRFIYLVRDPIARIESQFNHGFLRRTEWAYDDYLNPSLLNLSRYYMQLQQYLLRFPDRSRYRVLDFDELVGDPQRVMDGVFEWLQLDPIRISKDRTVNRAPRRSRLELLLADLELSWPQKLIPASIKRPVKDFLRKRTPARKKMTAEERTRAIRYLQRDIRLFGEEFDFPVEQWGF